MISLKEIENAYSRYSKEIFSYIIKSAYDHDTAEDLLQDVFIKLMNYSLKSSVDGSNIRALLYTIARSVCIDSARKSSRVKFEQSDVSTLADFHAVSDKDSSAMMMDALNSHIDSLGEPEKSIILFKRNGLTYPEIAIIMKISERTLKRKVKSVVSQLRIKLRNEGFFIPDDTSGRDGSLNE
jgi:RNA polymerase sigma-70 factor (ECF subfamily)